MGFFGSGDKTQTTQNTQTGASDTGLAVTTGAGGGGGVARDSATTIATGQFSTNKIGSSEIGGSLLANSLQNSTNEGTINYGLGTGDVQGLISGVTDTIGSILDKQNAAQANTLGSIGDLALTRATDGGSQNNSIGLYVALGALALLGFIFFRK